MSIDDLTDEQLASLYEQCCAANPDFADLLRVAGMQFGEPSVEDTMWLLQQNRPTVLNLLKQRQRLKRLRQTMIISHIVSMNMTYWPEQFTKSLVFAASTANG